MTETKKKILVFSQHFWPEEFRVNDLCLALTERGYQVDVVCGIPNYPTGKVPKGWGLFRRRREAWNGISIRRVLEIPRGSNKLWRVLLNFVSWPFFCLFHLPFLKHDYDLVLMYQLSPVIMAFPALAYRFFTRIPVVIYTLDYWPFSVFAVMDIKSGWMRRFITRLSRWHYRQADAMMAVFEGARDLLIEEVGLSPDKVLYLPQVCEALHTRRVRDEALHARFDGFFNIVFTGAVNPAQRFDIVVEAAKACHDAGYTDIHWVIVGDGMSRPAVEAQVAALGLTGVFHFEGMLPVEELPRYYDIADAFIVSLTRSALGDFGIPAKVQSYLAAARPILGALDGAGAEVIREADCGFVGPADDAAALAENVQKMANLPQTERERLGQNAYAYHLAHFERDSQMDRMVGFLERFARRDGK